MQFLFFFTFCFGGSLFVEPRLLQLKIGLTSQLAHFNQKFVDLVIWEEKIGKVLAVAALRHKLILGADELRKSVFNDYSLYAAGHKILVKSLIISNRTNYKTIIYWIPIIISPK